jgi:hypothetical protein
VYGNPVNFTDPSGHFPWDVTLDVASFAWSAYDFYNDPSWGNAGWLALDVVGLLPVVPSLGAVRHAGKLGLADEAVDVARRVDDVGASRQALHQTDSVIEVSSIGAYCSFSAGTLVVTETGLHAISSLTKDDYVLAYNEATDEIDYYPVTEIWARQHQVVVYLTIDGELIETTLEHPFYTIEGEWVTAGALHVGDHIRGADGSDGVVERVELGVAPQVMYNLTVAEAHTYFVGVGQWLVHNHCGKWVSVNESMSLRARLYQLLITGNIGRSYVIDSVRFDGFRNGILLDAKGPGYARFVENDQFKAWWGGSDALLDQAQRQISVSNGRHPIEWHVAEEDAANAIRNLLNSNGYGAISVIHSPF